MNALRGSFDVDEGLRSIRARNFQRLSPLDDELLALVGDDINNAFLTNPAIHTVYQYLVDYVCDFGAHWFELGGRKLDVLDWGSGKGHISYLLQKRGVNVTSADRSSDAPDSSFGQSTPIIDKTGLSVVRLEHDYRLPFADATFDVVLSVGVLEHVPNDLASLKEIRRVLRPGGLFFCFFLPYTLSWTQRLLHLAGSRYHDRLYSVSTVRNLLQASDLRLLDLWHRQLFPKNSVRYRGYRRVERADQWMTDRTPLRLIATNIEFVAMKPAIQGPGSSGLPDSPPIDDPVTPDAAEGHASPSVLLDCRWLGLAGAGRITELLLRDLVAEPPVGDWTLWGDPRLLEGLTFPGSRIVPWRGYPPRLFGQWDFLRVPRADVYVYLHQIRPLRGGHVVTMIYDTTPLTVARNALVREAKRLFFRLSARRSRIVLTLSNASRRSIASDLRVSGKRILVAHPPIDEARANRLRNLRADVEVRPVALFVGRFGEHKNLRRLASAFQVTGLCADGGTLILVGGTPRETATLADWVVTRGLTGVDVRAACSEEALDDLMVTSAVLVAPSLVEGYGLPAFEAASIGLPVAVSRTGAMGDLPEDIAEFLDPLDESSIASAIDRAAARRHVRAYVPAADLRNTVVSAIRIAAS